MPRSAGYSKNLAALCFAAFLGSEVAYSQTQTISLSTGGGTLTYTQSSATLGCIGSTFTSWTFSNWQFVSPSGVTDSYSNPVTYTPPQCANGGFQGSNPLDLSGKDYTIHISFAAGSPPSVSVSTDIYGRISPKFLVFSVAYAPPSVAEGTSSIDYSNGFATRNASTSVGFSADLRPGIAGGQQVAVSLASSPVAFPLTAGLNAQYQQFADSLNSIAFTKTGSWGNTFTTPPNTSPTPVLNHDSDELMVWLNPVLTFKLTDGSNVLQWTGYDFDPNDTFAGGNPDFWPVRVSELRNPANMTSPTVAEFSRYWDYSNRGPVGGAITAADYAAILSADPLASGVGTTLDRYDQAIRTSVSLNLGLPAQGTLAYEQISPSGLSSSHSYNVNLAYSSAFPSMLSALQQAFPQTFKWTSVASQHSSDAAGQTVPYSLAYTSGDEMFFYYRDNVYGTFAFVPIRFENNFIPVAPCRIADTRGPTGDFGGPELTAGATRTFTIPSSACGIPSNASAYSLNLTVVPDDVLGYLQAWGTGTAQPATSILNSDGRVKANAAIVKAGDSGAISVYASNQTHLIVDINGYFVPAVGGAGEQGFSALTSCRVLDTRGATGPLGGPYLSAGQSREIPVRSTCNVPSYATAYSMNFTAIPHQPIGFLATWPSGQTLPLVSTLNTSSTDVTANAAIVAAGSDGGIQVYSSSDTDLVIDINGYFAPHGVNAPYSLYLLDPCRVSDSRQANGALTGDVTMALTNSTCTLGAVLSGGNLNGLLLNATVVPQAPLNFLSLWAAGQPWPGVSTLNATDLAVTSNQAFVPTADGNVAIRASNPTNLILDLTGYFAP